VAGEALREVASLDVRGTTMSAAIQGIYIALFGRPADPGGLAYWVGVTKNGADLSEMLRVLPSLPEYTDRFAGQTPDQVITTVYQNLFGRDPDAEGLAFFKGQLASGAQTLATIAVNIMQGAQGDDKADVQAKVDAAQLFTESLDTPAEIAAYTGNDAAALAKKFLDTVDKDKPATPDSVEKASAAVVAGEDPTGGQAPNPGGGGGVGGGETPEPTPLELAQAEAEQISAKWIEHNAEFYHLRDTYPGGPEAVSGAYTSNHPVDSVFGETLGAAARALNIAVGELGLQYAKLIENFPSVALTDVWSFNTPDVRQQSVHDNLLGNINAGALDARNLLGHFQEALNAIADGAYANRPWFSGYTDDFGKAAHDAVRAFDWARDIDRSDSWVDAVLSGTVDDVGINSGNGYLYFGKSNTTDNFNIVRHEGAGIEIALKAKVRLGGGEEYEATGLSSDGAAVFHVETGTSSATGWTPAKWSFDYSIISGLNGSAADLEDFVFTLSIDVDPSDSAENPLLFTLTPEDGKLIWISGDGVKLGGDESAPENVEQNSFNIGFNDIITLINANIEGEYAFDWGQFDIEIAAWQDDVKLVANSIEVNVGTFEH